MKYEPCTERVHKKQVHAQGYIEYFRDYCTAHCNNNNISAAIVSIDQAKAFDTIWHGFVRAPFKFFGVGDFFLDMLDTLGTNRQAQLLYFQRGKILISFP
jgi:hypothetical protein